MDGGYGCIIKKHGADAGDIEMMQQVGPHFLPVDADKVAFGNHPRCKGHGARIHEAVEQIGLTGEHKGKKGFGVHFKLT